MPWQSESKEQLLAREPSEGALQFRTASNALQKRWRSNSEKQLAMRELRAAARLGKKLWQKMHGESKCPRMEQDGRELSPPCGGAGSSARSREKIEK
jgi:hypothetical protein